MTPFEEYPTLAEKLGIKRLFIKREDLNPSGSHKDRTIWPLLAYYARKGKESFVIPSSGNAAISAAYYLKHNDEKLRLDIFVSPEINKEKRERLSAAVENQEKIHIHLSPRAKSDALRFAREKNSELIRTSTDAIALEGYKVLARELLQNIGENLDIEKDKVSLFIPTSSGTTVEGLFEGFKKLKIMPALNIVQTEYVAPIARELDSKFERKQSSKASAVVDTIAHRKPNVLKAVRESKGSGYVVSDEALEKAKNLLEETTPIRNISWDSLLALAGTIKAKEAGRIEKNVILLFTGR